MQLLSKRKSHLLGKVVETKSIDEPHDLFLRNRNLRSGLLPDLVPSDGKIFVIWWSGKLFT